jgi:DNA-binding transcriptional regulator YiaG
MARKYIGQELRALRERAGQSQQGLAKVLGVHWRSIQDWEADRTAVDEFKAEALLARIRGLAKKGKGR